METHENQTPSLETQRRELRKPGHVPLAGQGLHMRLLRFVQSYFTYVLIRTRISSRVVTLAWFLVALVAYAVIAIGTPWSFAIGAAILYLKTILDIADGEVGRYQGRFMSAEADLRTHMQGIYLDRIQHAIENPLWGLALGWGAYHLTGNPWMVACGVSIAVFRTFVRYDGMLQDLVLQQFRDRVETLAGSSEKDSPRVKTRGLGSLPVRIGEKVMLWLRNGKRFNHVVFLLGCTDWLSHAVWGVVFAIPALLVFAGIACPCAMIVRIVKIQFSNVLVERAQQEALPTEPSPASSSTDKG